MRATLPVIIGVIPFGLVMGTVAHDANLTLLQTMGMNVAVFAGASQLAAVGLMTEGINGFVVIATGVIINLRFVLYSASLATFLGHRGFWTKFLGGYSVTDQTFSVLVASSGKISSEEAKVHFYFGSSALMVLTWQASVLLGFIFGNVAPKSLSLDYAVPLSFMALAVPTLRNKNYVVVALTAGVLSVLLHSLPFNLGLLISALLALGLGAFLTRKESRKLPDA